MVEPGLWKRRFRCFWGLSSEALEVVGLSDLAGKENPMPRKDIGVHAFVFPFRVQGGEFEDGCVQPFFDCGFRTGGVIFWYENW